MEGPWQEYRATASGNALDKPGANGPGPVRGDEVTVDGSTVVVAGAEVAVGGSNVASHALRSHSAAVTSRSQALRSRPVRSQVLAARRGRAGGPVLVSPAAVRAQMTLTYRELADAARRRAITRARELGLLDG
jgi:hypothetical protein